LENKTRPHSHVNTAVYFAQILKIFARIMANFSALGMRPHPVHPHAVRLCFHLLQIVCFFSFSWFQLQTKQNQPTSYYYFIKITYNNKRYTQIIMGVGDYSKRQLKTIRFPIWRVLI